MRLFAVFSLLLVFFLGCSSQPDSPTAIQGRIFFLKQPLAGGTIVFIPDPTRGSSGPMASAEILADGSFAIQPQPGKEPPRPGWYRVTMAPSTANLPARFSDPGLSGLVREIKGGIVNNFDFYLE
ncbi:MAG: hypothetical protein EXR99_09480 [Gemmataceae bacterium]|nr:hypothetical protein [Gemmataceae bacterium]